MSTHRPPTAPVAPRRPLRARKAQPPPWLEAALAAAAGVLFMLAWRSAPIEAEIADGPRTARVATRAGTVGALLVEQGVALGRGDLVAPPVAARLEPGMRIEVRRAVRVRIHADGAVHRLASHGRSARAVLADAGIALGPGDRVAVNGAPATADAPLDGAIRAAADPPGVRVADARALPVPPRQERPLPEGEAPPPADGEVATTGPMLPRGAASALAAMEPAPADALDPRLGTDDALVVAVWRAQPIELVEDGVAMTVRLAGATVREGLEGAGIAVWPEDVLEPPGDAPLRGVGRIAIRRATPFVVRADQASRDVRAWAQTVGEGLERAGVGLLGRDYSVPPADAPLTPGLVVQIVRVREDVLVEQTPIAFAVETEPDPAMALDQTRVIRPGVPGLKEQRIRITYEDGREIDRVVEAETVLAEPVAERVAYGTQIAWGTVDTPEGPKRYWRKLRVYATSYSAARAGTPRSAPWYGRTRLGLVMRKGIVAVDPRVIPLGTNLYVPGFGVGLAGDTGGGIRNYHIDLGFDDDNYESWHQNVDLYLLEPLPPEGSMRWILP